MKANPERANYGSSAPDTLPHLLAFGSDKVSGSTWSHIGYGATARPIKVLVSGHIPIVFYSTKELVELHKAGRIRVLATSAGTVQSFGADMLLPSRPNASLGVMGENLDLLAKARLSKASRSPRRIGT